MLLLAFETSAKAASVALMRDDELLGESYQNTGLTHSQTLMVMAEDLLKQCGFTAQDVTHVAVAAGPGSFTGVRIGVAAAKGFAWGKDIPCYGVSTLHSMALGFGAYDGIVCAVMDARRNQVYNALFTCESGVVTRLCDDRALAIAELGDELDKLSRPVYLMGDGAQLIYDAHKERLGDRLRLLPERLIHQSGYNTAMCALRLWRDGVRTTDTELAPVYLRLSQAERTRAERLAAEGKA